MKTFIDQLGSTVKLSSFPQRIVSLVPSQTELLGDLGLEDQVVGITKFCIHPTAWRESKSIIGGTKQFRFDVIQSLQPDLIIGNKEENYQEGIDQLRLSYPVWMSDIVLLEDAYRMIEQVGELTSTYERATDITGQIRNVFSGLEQLPPLRTLYLIWRNPWMAAAPGTFIHEMMKVAGLKNCLSHYHRYPELNRDELESLNPELILLSSEPYPFRQKHVNEIKTLCPGARIMLVDGEMFSWYGSRLVKFPAYVKSLIPVLL